MTNCILVWYNKEFFIHSKMSVCQSDHHVCFRISSYLGYFLLQALKSMTSMKTIKKTVKFTKKQHYKSKLFLIKNENTQGNLILSVAPMSTECGN